MILGVTGPSGAGKGTVSKFLEAYGFFHIDTDLLVPDLYPKVLPELICTFGPEIVSEDGNISKPKLAAKVFSNPEALQALNSILHPKVMERVKEIICTQQREGTEHFCVDGAALFEAHGEEYCDKMLCVLAPTKDRILRIMQRDGISMERAVERVNGQKEDSFYTERADFVIQNTDLNLLKKEIKQIKEMLIP